MTTIIRRLAAAAFATLAVLAAATPSASAGDQPTATVTVTVTCDGAPQAGVRIWLGAESGDFHVDGGETDATGVRVTSLPYSPGSGGPIGWSFEGRSGQFGRAGFDVDSTWTAEVCEAADDGAWVGGGRTVVAVAAVAVGAGVVFAVRRRRVRELAAR